MPDPFASSRQKLAWAKDNLLPDLHKRILEFGNGEPYAKVVEADPQRPDWEVYKIKLVTQFPEAFGNLTSDIVVNLRSALDNATFAIAVAIGVSDIRNAAFPFAKDAGNMASSIGRAADLPKEVQSFLCGLQPYRGGDDLLWALNELCNGNKHKFVTPLIQVMARGPGRVRGFGRPFEMPDPPVWDSAKNEMVIVKFGPLVVPDAQWEYDFDFRPNIAIHEIPVVEGQPVLRVLYELCLKVESVLNGIEAESRRLKIVT